MILAEILSQPVHKINMRTLTIKFLIAIILINAGFITAFAQNNKELKKLREVKIYLLKEIGDDEKNDPENPLWLFPVKRLVNADSPLTGSLKALVKGETKAEELRKYHSSTFGIKFVSVSVKNGEVIARFTIPKNVSFSGDNGLSIFREAVRKTAMQFKEVKKVSIYLNGVKDDGNEEY